MPFCSAFNDSSFGLYRLSKFDLEPEIFNKNCKTLRNVATLHTELCSKSAASHMRESCCHFPCVSTLTKWKPHVQALTLFTFLVDTPNSCYQIHSNFETMHKMCSWTKPLCLFWPWALQFVLIQGQTQKRVFLETSKSDVWLQSRVTTICSGR